MYTSNVFSMPIREVSPEGIICSNSGAITVGYEVNKAALTSLSTEQQAALNQVVVKACGILPPGCILHFQDQYFKKEWEAPGSRTFLGRASDRHFFGRPYLDNRCYLYITLPTPGHKPSHSGISSLLRRSLTPAPLRDNKAIGEFEEKCQQFAAILNDSKMLELRRLLATELTGDKTSPGLIEQYISLSSSSDIPRLGDIAFEKEGVRVFDKSCVIYTLADAELLPEQCSPSSRYEPLSTAVTTVMTGFASRLGPLLKIEHIYTLIIVFDDPAKALATLEKRRRRLQSLSDHSPSNAVAAEDIAKVLQEAAVGDRRLVRVHGHVMAWGRHPEELTAIKQQIIAAMTRMGIVPYLETVGAPQVWYGNIPGNADDFPINDAFTTFLEQAICFMVPETNDRNSDSPFGIRLVDRHTGRPLHIDLSDEPKRRQWANNLNKFVLAGSGGGKSYFICLLIRCYHEYGVHIVVVDIGGSYRNLCTLLKGRYFTYSEKNPIRFSPFRLEKGEMPDIEKKESLKTLLLTLWKKSDETFYRSEYVALSNALHGYYQWLAGRREIAACFDSFYDYLRDIYRAELKAAKVKTEDFDMDNFLYVLRPYYKGGEYDYLLNAVDQPGLLHEQLIVFDIDEIKDHPILFPVVTIIIMDVFISKMRQLHGIRKAIIIEEAWKAIAKEGMDEYTKYLFKTVRKHFGEAIVVTQDIEDIISSPVVKNAIINNSDCKILLDQSKMIGRYDEIQKLLGLSDYAVAMVMSVNKAIDRTRKYKEAFVGYANGDCHVYAVETSLEEYLTFTTEESEKVLVAKYAEQEGGLEKGIITLAQKIRSGAVKLFLLLVFLFLQKPANAQVLEIIGLINAAVKKVIVATDLQVQRLQTETIALQDAEKALENSMAGDLLGDITDWVQQQEALYGAYYQELWQVKSALAVYSKTATLIQRQAALVKEEQQDWAAVQRDPHFSATELSHIASVYNGILNESSRNVQQIGLVIQVFITQMDDAGRLLIIDETSKGIDDNYQDLRQFTQENSLLSLQRAKDENDLLTIKSLYNLP